MFQGGANAPPPAPPLKKPLGARPKLLQMSGLAITSVSNSRPSIRPSIIRCKAINSVTVMEIPVQLEPMLSPGQLSVN